MFISKPFKKWIAVFRGEVSPVLILLSVATGLWFGVTPGFYGIHVCLLVIALILNIHFGIFLLTAALGKSISLAAAPLMYYVGAWVQGALAPLLGLMAAVPILGITDFARYAVAGAVVVGPVLGILLGGLLARSVVGFRKSWLKLDQNSEAFKTWTSKKWVRFLSRLLIGKGTQDVQTVLVRRPKIIRPAGVILAVVLVVGSVIGVQFIPQEKLATYAADALTKLNGAEVNIASLSLEPFAGRITASGIQVTDPANPSNNRVSVGSLKADAGLYALLLGKVVMDNIELSTVEFDQPRQTAGRVVSAPEPEAAEPEKFDPKNFDIPDVDVHQLESYFKNAQKIRDVLAKIEPWLPRKEAKAPAAEPPQKYLEYLAARAPTEPSPRFVAKRIFLENVELPVEQLGRSNIECLNLSDAPLAAGMPVTFEITSVERKDRIKIVSHYEAPDRGADITAQFDDVALDGLQDQLSSKNPVVFKSGRASASVEGKAHRDALDLRIKVKTQNMVMESSGGGLFGLDPRVTSEAMKYLSSMDADLRLVGPLLAPRLVFDVPALKDAFKTALVDAGKDQLAQRLGAVVGDKLPAGQDAPKEIIEGAKDAIGGLGGLLGGKKKDKEKK